MWIITQLLTQVIIFKFIDFNHLQKPNVISVPSKKKFVLLLYEFKDEEMLPFLTKKFHYSLQNKNITGIECHLNTE